MHYIKILNYALALAAGLFVFTSCSNEADDIVENVDNNIKVKKVIGVGTQAAVSRTAISGWEENDDFNPDKLSVHWQNGDELTVFAEGHTEGDTFRFADFMTGETHNLGSFEGLSYQSGPYYVLYPAQKGARLVNGNEVKLNIPNKQNAVKGSFDPKANILLGKKVGSLEDGQTDLHNVCSYFRITVPADCNSVKVKAKNENWHLAGTVTVQNIGSGGNHIYKFESDCTNEIELTGFSEAGTYFIAFIPTTGMNSDLQVTVNTERGITDVSYEHIDGGFSLAAGSFYNLGKFE